MKQAGRYGYTDSGTGSRSSLTAAGKGESIARLGSTVPSNSSPTGGYQGGPVDEAYVARRTEELLTQYAEDTKRRYRDYDTGLNVRSPEGRARRAEKQELYRDWQKAESLLAKHKSEMTRKAADTAAIAGVVEAEKYLAESGYNANNYPKNAPLCSFDGSFASENEMLSYMGSMLNRFTQESNQEHMCNIYELTMPDGSKEYAASTIYAGEKNNVINPYMNDMFGAKGEEELLEQYPDAKIDYLGMLHSHPNDRQEDNDNFSWGDAIVSVLSGRIYLDTPEGHVYALDGKDGWKLIVPGYMRDRVNAADWQLYYGTVEEEELPKWIVEALAEDYIAKHDAKSKGSNFVTFDINTYNTRK